MSAEPAPLSPSFPAPLAPARLGRPERIAFALLAALATLLLAAWQIPPLLDWSRYRGTIATFASARLGRRVAITGQVRLNLLPRPVLLADGVSLADRGDGISARLGTLRLEVALPSLLAGHIVPRALSLDNPTARLPWPPPRGTAPHLPARVAGAFSATVNGGTLIVGGITLRDITGSLRTDPDTGAFAAQGNARLAGLPWRFTALLGAPGADGVSPLSLTLDGLPALQFAPEPQSAPATQAATAARTAPDAQPASPRRLTPDVQPGPNRQPAPDLQHAPDMRGTGGAFTGRLLADGSLAGTLVLRGPDLSRLGGGPAIAWQAQGAIAGEGLTLRTPALDLRLAGEPGRADITLRLDPPAALTVHASLGRLPAGAWMLSLLRNATHSAIAADIDLAASALQTPRALLRSPRLHLVLGPEGAAVRAASIILPGGTKLAGSGSIDPAGGRAAGQLDMQAPALHDMLDWLAGSALGLPVSILATADLHGAFAAEPGRLTWSGLSGRVDGSPVTGKLDTTLAVRPSLSIDLSTPRLPLAGWDWPPARPSPAFMPRLAAMLDLRDVTLKLAAGQIDWPGLPLDHAMLEAEANGSGITLHRLALDLATHPHTPAHPDATDGIATPGHVEASGHLGFDGTLEDGRADLATPDAASLPAAWRVPARLWQGGFHLALKGAGPPRDIAVALRADLGDLRAEAEGHLDATSPALEATATLRHPGAPRLLDALGLGDTRAWLDDGSFAMLAHLALSPHLLQARDFSIAAGALQIGGAFAARLNPGGLQIDGDLDAPMLALPALANWPAISAAPLDWALLRTLQARIAIKADRVLSGLTPLATDAAATLLAGNGVAFIGDARAHLPHGELAGALALDSRQDPPAVAALGTVTGLASETLLPATPSPPGLALQGGLMDVSADVYATRLQPGRVACWLGRDVAHRSAWRLAGRDGPGRGGGRPVRARTGPPGTPGARLDDGRDRAARRTHRRQSAQWRG